MKKKIVKKLTDQQLEVIWYALCVKDSDGGRTDVLKVPAEERRPLFDCQVDFNIWDAVDDELRARGAKYAPRDLSA
jgi:hypothetical protein